MPDKSGGYGALWLPAITGVREKLSVYPRQNFRNAMTQRQVACRPNVDAS